MSKNTILPEGMYWYYNSISKEFSLIVEKDCKYKKISVERKSLKTGQILEK